MAMKNLKWDFDARVNRWKLGNLKFREHVKMRGCKKNGVHHLRFGNKKSRP